MTTLPNLDPLKAAKLSESSQGDEAKRNLKKSSIPAKGGIWDDFFEAPGADLGSRDQPALK